MSRTNVVKWASSLAAFLVIAMVLAACGGDTTEAPDTTAASDTTTEAPDTTTEAPDTTQPTETTQASDEWDEIVAAAIEEGSVTVYSARPLDQFLPLVAAFEEKYPEIEVHAERLLDGEIGAKIEAEYESGNIIADFFNTSARSNVEVLAAAGDRITPPVGPAFDNPDYSDEYKRDDGSFETAGAVLGVGWNTELYPAGISDFPDLLVDELAGGRIAVIDPAVSPAIVHFWFALEERLGEDFLTELAAQEPRIYTSAIPIGEALAAGEVAASSFVLPLTGLMEAGAPVDFAIPPSPWGSRFSGVIVEGSPHPNAAQVFANFVVSREGQEVGNVGLASVLPNVEGALAEVRDIPPEPLGLLTPEFVEDYINKWADLFQ